MSFTIVSVDFLGFSANPTDSLMRRSSRRKITPGKYADFDVSVPQRIHKERLHARGHSNVCDGVGGIAAVEGSTAPVNTSLSMDDVAVTTEYAAGNAEGSSGATATEGSTAPINTSLSMDDVAGNAEISSEFTPCVFVSEQPSAGPPEASAQRAADLPVDEAVPVVGDHRHDSSSVSTQHAPHSSELEVMEVVTPCVFVSEQPAAGIVPYSSSDSDTCSNDFFSLSSSCRYSGLLVPAVTEDIGITDSESEISDSDSNSSLVIPVYDQIGMHLPDHPTRQQPDDELTSESDDVELEEAESAQLHENNQSRRQKSERVVEADVHITDRASRLQQEDEQTSEREEDECAQPCENNQSVKVAMSTHSTRRKWDKRDFCKFCEKPQAKLIRHMTLKHGNEHEVAGFLALPLKSRRRLLMQKKLRNDGNYMHNVDVLEKDDGEIIPVRRPSASDYSSQDFIPCEYCRAMYVKHNLWKHQKKCPFKPPESSNKRCQGSGSLLLPFSSEASEGLKRDIMTAMNQDDVTSVVRVDDLIMKFGSRLHFKHSHVKHRFPYIKERIRQMGRFLLEVKKTVSVGCLADCLDPQYFDSVVTAVRSVCGFSEDEHVYKTPSLALKIGHSLKECTRIQINNCALQGLVENKQKYKQFLSLCDTEWCHEISSHALRSLHQRKFNKPLVLPLAEDVKMLHSHLAKKAKACTEKLACTNSAAVWCELCQVTLTQVVIFNRRRGGEAERMLLSAYTSSNVPNVSEDVQNCLSEVERALCREFRIIYTEGKRGRKVPVLLTKSSQDQINVLLELRSSVGVLPTNAFLFARRSSDTPYRSSDCLRRFAAESGARNPSTLTSTKLRKHVATMSQMLALRKNELDLLATFLGHNIDVHREFYRLPEQTLQVAKVSKLLLAMEHGETRSLQGRNLDDVDVNVPGVKFSFLCTKIVLML